jgi:hypothetical protein
MLANEALRYAAYSVSAALATLILLLLLGTQILGWVWLFLLPAVTLAAGAYMTWRSAPSPYRVAQLIDRQLRLADAISTALFFAPIDPAGQADPADRRAGMRRAQWEQAEGIAAGVDPRRAVPVKIPRALYGTVLLTLAAGSLFALRYGLDRRLDLRVPLARIIQDKLGYTEARQAARDRHNPAPHDPKRPGEAGLSLDDSQQKIPGELDAAPDLAPDAVGVPDAGAKTASSRPENSKLAQSTELEGEQNKSEEADGVSANAGDQPSADGRKGPSAGKPGKQGQGDDKQASGDPGENSSLLGKFRDAMSSLMNRMRQQSGAKGAQQQAGAQNGSQQKSQSGNSGQNGKQGEQPGDGQQADAKDGQPGDDSQNAQNAQSGSPGQSGQQPATKQPGSGIGRQDGSKDVKLAEQLAAMGKISEIIGKRAANVTGELTVEVENSNQQLRTQYAQRDAHHAEAGGEINRDEVPVALQPYVQQYFEQVRKQAAHQRTEPPKSSKPGL